MASSTQIGPIGQIARTVRDIEASLAWYRDRLGLALLYQFDGMAFFDAGGIRLYLQQGTEAGAESILYFRVEDIVASHAALVQNGIDFMREPHRVHRHEDGTEEWMAFFADPDGRPLALMSARRITDTEKLDGR